ncbi:MAG: hypothetical protein ACTTIC_01280 [Helicobacteraceae bacterium]
MNWDEKSEQPFVMMDRRAKRAARLRQPFEMLKIALSGLLYLAALPYGYFFQRKKSFKIAPADDFFCVNVNPKILAPQILALVKDLGVRRILIRVMLWDVQQLKAAKDLAAKLEFKAIFALIPSRNLVLDNAALLERTRRAVQDLTPHAELFIFGLAINRSKWDYITPAEYLSNLEAVNTLRAEFANMRLAGSSVIDYEFLITARTLFNGFSFRLDLTNALLYVDRRGDPQNSQGGLNLIGKLATLALLNRLSPKSARKLCVSEFNWSLKDTFPYLPTSNYEAVSPHEQAVYLVKYYCLALTQEDLSFASWHQLIHESFGLVRPSGEKNPSFFAMKFLVSSLAGKKRGSLRRQGASYELFAADEKEEIFISWGIMQKPCKKYKYYKICGDETDLSSCEKDEIIYKKRRI